MPRIVPTITVTTVSDSSNKNNPFKINRIVNNVKHYDHMNQAQKSKFTKKLLSNLKYFGCSQPVKVLFMFYIDS